MLHPTLRPGLLPTHPSVPGQGALGVLSMSASLLSQPTKQGL